MFCEVPQIVHRYYGKLLTEYRKTKHLFEKVDGKEHFELYHIASLGFFKLNTYIYLYKKNKKI